MEEYYDDPIRAALEAAILDEAEYLKILPGGSDERKRSTECFVALHGAYCRDCDTASRLFKDQEEVKLNERKFLEDARRSERETEVKEATAEKQAKWYNQEITRTVAVCMVSLISTGICMKVNAGDMPFRTALEKYLITLKPKV